jgi:hypothetical protein
MVQRVAFAAGLALLAIVPANAASITTLYNTGVNNLGVATTGSAADLHWTLAGGPAYTGGVNGTFPIGPWVSDTATSRWVTPTRSARDANAVASYSYSTTFLLAGLSAASASFSGQFAADDTVTAIVLNGTTISAGGGGFSAYTAFASTGGSFLAGTNTLTLVTLNSGGGPAGLHVEVAGTANTAGAVLEASVWMMMISGFGLVGFAARRRSSVVAA